MNWKNIRRLVVAVNCAVVLLIPAALYPCGPVFFSPAFVLPDPQDPAKYAAGDLGIPLRSYSNVDVFIAYRYLSGEPLTKEEQASVYNLPHGINTFAAVYDENGINDITKPWVEARTQTAGAAPPQIVPFKEGKQYEFYLNCPPPAFVTAALTLADRSKKYSPDELKNWVAAQDAVFSNCSGKAVNQIPPDVPASASELAKQDRAYQIAAANFYAGYFDNAITGFREIAADKASPWHRWGEFLVGRSFIRKATLNPQQQDQPYDPKALAEAESVLQKVIADPELASVHNAAQQMLGFIDLRLHPGEMKTRIAAELAKPQSADVIRRDLGSYVRLLGDEANQPNDDMTQWIAAFYKFGTANPEDEREHPATSGQEVIDRWQHKKTLPWLTVAVSAAQPGDKGLKELLGAAEMVKPDSPAYATIRYHLARLANEQNNTATARKIADNFLAQAGSKTSASTRNMFLSERLTAAANLADFLDYAQRRPVLMSTGVTEWDQRCEGNVSGCNQLYLDPYAARAFDSMPLSIWMDAANSRELDSKLRTDIAFRTWCRAVLVQDWSAADQAARTIEALMPDSAKYLEAFLKAGSTNAKEFAAVYAILHWPGIQPTMSITSLRDDPLDQINNLRMNWWCTYGRSVGIEQSGEPRSQLDAPSFLTSAQKQLAHEQQQRVLARKLAPNYLVPVVITWAKENANDRRVPEALALSVKTTRYSCSDDKTSGYSKAAFTLLHSKYPKSEWAKRTKYYY